ncbi:hypothetical protein [Variovorax sp. V15]|uniref:hypothetical protein n=1 Tax=Variovorax sp. V15 TaxID=3065952 RepID=UPI0034E852F5
MTHVRRISVHVDEPDPGHFYWVLMEEGDDASQWLELQSAEEGYDMWIDALQAGMWALERLAEDERIGPRIDRDDEGSSPVGMPLR